MNPTTSAIHRPLDHLAGTLIREIERYLETVELFRDLGCEPTWERDETYAGRAVELIAPYLDRMSPV